jgi:hypothetical protein
MVLAHGPENKLFVDLAEKMLPYIDRDTGEAIKLLYIALTGNNIQ